MPLGSQAPQQLLPRAQCPLRECEPQLQPHAARMKGGGRKAGLAEGRPQGREEGKGVGGLVQSLLLSDHISPRGDGKGTPPGSWAATWPSLTFSWKGSSGHCLGAPGESGVGLTPPCGYQGVSRPGPPPALYLGVLWVGAGRG